MSEARDAVASAMSPLFDMGVKAERERIIELLKAETFLNENGYIMLSEFWSYIEYLIKGEN